MEKWVCCQFLDATSFSWSLYRNYATCRLKIYGIKNNGKGILELALNNLAFSPKFFCMLEASKFQITLHGWIDRPYMNFWSRGFLPWNYVNSLENFSSSSLHNIKKFSKKSIFKGLLSHCDPAHYCLFKTWYDPSGLEPFVLDKNFSFSSSITSAADKSFICSKSRCFSCIFDASFDRLIMNNFSAEFVLIFMHIHNFRIIQLGSVRKTTPVHFFSWQISGPLIRGSSFDRWISQDFWGSLLILLKNILNNSWYSDTLFSTVSLMNKICGFLNNKLVLLLMLGVKFKGILPPKMKC